MRLQNIKNRILESTVGYSLWSAPLNRPKVRAIQEMLRRADKTSGSILDIGCGPGSNTSLFSKWSYLGIDLNPKYIDDARVRFADADFAVGDATDPPIGGRRFDVVLINSLMHHLNDEQCRAMLRRVTTFIESGAVVIIQEPLIPDPGERLKNFFMRQDRGEHFRSLKEWQHLFVESGFSITAESFYPLKLANVVTAWRMYSILLTPVADSANRS